MNRQKDLETIVVLILFQLVLFWFTGWPVFLFIGFFLGIIGLILPAVSNAINIAWMN